MQHARPNMRKRTHHTLHCVQVVDEAEQGDETDSDAEHDEGQGEEEEGEEEEEEEESDEEIVFKPSLASKAKGKPQPVEPKQPPKV